MKNLLPPLPRKPAKRRVKVLQEKPETRVAPISHEQVELQRRAAEKTRLEMEEERKKTDEEERLRKMQMEAALARQAAVPGTHRPLTTDEKLFIIEAYFEKGVGPTAIAEQLERAPSSIVRFIQRQKSTGKLAKLHLEHNALRLARRVVKKADVNQALEVLHRVDALPRKDQNAGSSVKFNIVIGAGPNARPPIPDQLTIEAAATSVEDVD